MGAWLLLSLLHAGGALAEPPVPACAERDFRAKLGTPRMQDGTSWCYANSAADLITQHIGERVSAIDLATTYLLVDETQLRKNKDPQLRQYLERHPEFEKQLRESRKEDEAYQPNHILYPEGMVDTGGRDDEAIVLANIKGLCLAAKLPAGEENLNKYLDAIREDYITNDHDDVPSGPIGAVENNFAKIMAHSFQKWVDQKCGRRVRPREALLPHEVKVAENLDDFNHQVKNGKLEATAARASLVAELDRVLDDGKVAAIAYDSFDLYPRADTAKPGNGRGDHSSVVAARKKIDGVCHYFVRNHFGATCGYRKELDERCEKENGGVWVTAEALQHLYSVISIR